jgi:hypothetical protein
MTSDRSKLLFFCLCFFVMCRLSGQSQWTELRVGPSAAQGYGYPSSMCLDKAGNLYVAEADDIHNTGSYVAKWNGNFWSRTSQCGDNFNGSIQSLAIGNYGELYAGGGFTWGYTPTYGIGALYGDTAQWVDIGGSDASLMCVDSSNNLYVVTNFSNSYGNYYVSSPVGGELGGTNALAANDYISALYSDHKGNIYAAGNFTNRSGKKYVAKWNGSIWSEMGTGTGRIMANSSIYTITGDSMGNIYAAGFFTDSNGKAYVAKWNDTAWVELGTGASALNAVQGWINTIAVDRSGNLYAAGGLKDSTGHYFVAKWNGISWSKLGQNSNSLSINGPITTMCIDTAENIFIGGTFSDSFGHGYVLEWNGNSWKPLGLINFLNPYRPRWEGITMLMCNTDSLVYGGPSINSEGYYCIAKWSGANSYEVGTGANALNAHGALLCMCHDLSGNIYAAGTLLDSLGSSSVFKWNGTKWSSIGALTHRNGNDGTIGNLSADSKGYIYAQIFYGNPQPYGAGKLMMWNDTTWTDISPYNLDYAAYYLCPDKHGSTYLGGYNLSLNREDILKWNGASWTEIMAFTPGGARMSGICADTAGNLYINGTFNDSSGRASNMAIYQTNGVIKYDSTGFAISSLLVTPQNRLCAISDSGYREWNGLTWQYVKVNGYCLIGDGSATTFCADYDNNIYLSGSVDLGIGRGIIDGTTGFGCVVKYHDTSSFYIDTLTSIFNISKGSFQVYPNPSTGIFLIQFPNPTSGIMSIFDIEGKQLLTWTVDGSSQKLININTLTAGSYIMSLIREDGSKESKMIVRE